MEKWPFKDMEVGDKVIIEGCWRALKASKYAHIYGASSGKRFRVNYNNYDICEVERVPNGTPRAKPKPRRIKHPIWDLEVGQRVTLKLYQYTTTPPNIFAYNVARQTGRKFKCRKNDVDTCTWDIERIK